MRSAIKLTFCFIILSALTAESYSQQWKRYRKEVYFGLGATNFLGDLGGADRIGTDAPNPKALYRDLELVMTRPLAGAGYRYAIGMMQRVRGSLTWGILSGNDALTNEPTRHNRNLHFRSGVVELTSIYEYYFNQESRGHRYNIRGARGMGSKNLTYYGFAGVGLLYFNPKAQYNGRWVALRKLGTEGQGLPGGPKKYSPVTVCAPLGLGLKYAIDRNWRIGLELGYRKTLSDYIDDVSTNYYDNNQLRAAKGDAAAFLADPNKGLIPGQSNIGEQRGDPKDKDAYVFGVISLNYRLARRGARAKF